MKLLAVRVACCLNCIDTKKRKHHMRKLWRDCKGYSAMTTQRHSERCRARRTSWRKRKIIVMRWGYTRKWRSACATNLVISTPKLSGARRRCHLFRGGGGSGGGCCVFLYEMG